jgi:VanZ family protein
MLFHLRFLCKIAFWLALIAIYIAAIVPQNIAPHVGTLSDKLIHSLAFSFLAFLLQLAYRVNILKTIFFLLLYGLFIEASQYFTSSRSSEVLDVVADIVGIVMGILLYQIVKFIIKKYENHI